MAIHDREKWTCSSGGTLAYMAPEQLTRWTQQFDGRTDIWALGVVLYEMLTKKRPFTGGGEPNAIDRLVTEITQVSPRPPSQWNLDVPQSFDKICLRCLQRHIEDRYESAAAFSEAVREASRELEDRKTTLGKFFLADRSLRAIV